MKHVTKLRKKAKHNGIFSGWNIVFKGEELSLCVRRGPGAVAGRPWLYARDSGARACMKNEKNPGWPYLGIWPKHEPSQMWGVGYFSTEATDLSSLLGIKRGHWNDHFNCDDWSGWANLSKVTVKSVQWIIWFSPIIIFHLLISQWGEKVNFSKCQTVPLWNNLFI